jgi:hypothetical protein
MKKGALALSIFVFILMINFISAQDLLSDLLNNFDESMIILSAVFILSFSIIFFALNKSLFKDNTPIAGVISAVIAFLIVYGFNKTGFDLSGFFFEIGIPDSVIMTIVPLVVVAGIIFTIIKLKGNSLFVFSGLLFVLSFFVYAKGFLIGIAIVLLVIGFVILSRKKKDKEK